MTTYLGKELLILFTASAFRKLPSIYVFSYFPFGFEGRIWDLIVSVPDHCLSFYFTILSKQTQISNAFFPVYFWFYKKKNKSKTDYLHINRVVVNQDVSSQIEFSPGTFRLCHLAHVSIFNNFGFVPHFTRFHWSNNAHVEIHRITWKVDAYFNLQFSGSWTKIIAATFQWNMTSTIRCSFKYVSESCLPTVNLQFYRHRRKYPMLLFFPVYFRFH